MIITKLNGGLGNQMFQYAAGRSLADAHNDELFLDDIPLSLSHGTNTPRNYELDNFKIRAKRLNKIGSMILGKINQTIPIFKVIREKSTTFDPTIIGEKGNIILDGYWQSEKYFKKHTEILKKDFTFINKPDRYNMEILNDITKTQSVSIHVRRGDYVSNKDTNSFHGVCSIEYYQKAVQYIKKHTQKPKFFVFSDDPIWCQQNLILDKNIRIIDNRAYNSGAIDMQLMSQCKHNIIANSSFSWWGAWLNQNLGKIVIAPKHWFRKKSANAKDILPDQWIKL